MDTIKEYKSAVDDFVNKFMTNGTAASSLGTILNTNTISSAYNKSSQNIKSITEKYTESLYDKAEVNPETITNFSFIYAINRDVASRYICRKSLYKTANDKKMLRTYFLSCKNQAEE